MCERSRCEISASLIEHTVRKYNLVPPIKPYCSPSASLQVQVREVARSVVGVCVWGRPTTRTDRNARHRKKLARGKHAEVLHSPRSTTSCATLHRRK